MKIAIYQGKDVQSGCLKGRLELKRSVFNPPEVSCRLFGVNEDVLNKNSSNAMVMMDIHCNEQMWVVSRWVESVLGSGLCKCDQEIGLGHSCCSDR